MVFQWIMRMSYMALGLGFILCLWQGSSFYLTPFDARPHHPDYALWRPAGSYGLLFGIVGSCAMLLLLLYSIRRRTRLFGRKIPIKYWLDVHIFLGIFGPTCVLLHTSFKWGGLVSISFWSMVGVGLSGLLGRYLYVQIPRTLDGEESPDRGPVPEEHLKQQLADFPQLSHKLLSELMALFQREPKGSRKLSAMLRADLMRPWRHRQLYQRIGRDLPQPAASILFQKVKTLERRQQNHYRLAAIHKLFHLWHVIHRPFALIMYLIMFLHIGVAILFGIGWR